MRLAWLFYFSFFLVWIPRISNTWKTRRDELLQSAAHITASLSDIISASGQLDDNLLETSFQGSVASFDETHAGFGHAPKFPTAHRLTFMMRQNRRGAEMGHTDPQSPAARRNLGPGRFRNPPLLDRPRMARAALRESALRSGHARARLH